MIKERRRVVWVRRELVIPDGVQFTYSPGSTDTALSRIEWQSHLLCSGQLGGWDARVFYGGAPGWLRRGSIHSSEYLLEGSRHPARLHLQQKKKIATNSLCSFSPSDLVGLGVPRQELWIAQTVFVCPRLPGLASAVALIFGLVLIPCSSLVSRITT